MPEGTQQPDEGFTWTDEKVKEIISERDGFKQQVAEATAALKQTALIDEVYGVLGDYQVSDRYTAAKRIAGQLEVGDDGDVASAVKSWYEGTASLFTAPADATAQPDPEPEPPTPNPPGMTTSSGPSPANPGAAPPPEPLHSRSPEVEAAVNAGDWSKVAELVKSGQYQAAPGQEHRLERVRRK